MRKKVVWVLCLSAVCLLQANLYGGDDDAKAGRKELMKERRAIASDLRKLERTITQEDPEIVELKKTADEARKAFQTALQQKVQENPDGADLLARMETVSEQLKAQRDKKDKKADRKDKTDEEPDDYEFE